LLIAATGGSGVGVGLLTTSAPPRTYFAGARAASDSASPGPYFVEFSRRAKAETGVPVMATGGFKKREQAVDAVTSGAVDMVGLGRAMT